MDRGPATAVMELRSEMSDPIRTSIGQRAINVLQNFIDLPNPDIRLSLGVFLVLLGTLFYDVRAFLVLQGMVLLIWLLVKPLSLLPTETEDPPQ